VTFELLFQSRDHVRLVSSVIRLVSVWNDIPIMIPERIVKGITNAKVKAILVAKYDQVVF